MRLIVLVLSGIVCLSALRAEAPKDKKTESDGDLAHYIEMAKQIPPPAKRAKDPKTGFTVGGKNETKLIQGLKEINGRSIADLEKDMRPGAEGEVGSTAGFLGKDEKLIDVLAADNKYVVDELGLTHQELAEHLRTLGAIARWKDFNRAEQGEFVYHGRRFKCSATVFKGYQESPFYDDTRTDTDVTIENVATGKKIRYSLLVPLMIDRYGFYEGKGTRYRVEPSQVLEVFDFIKPKGKK
jgi:hypothetical protein